VQRSDDALIDRLAVDRIAYVPFFPLGGFVDAVRRRPIPQRDDRASVAGVAASPRAQYAGDPWQFVGDAPP
jgi:hypothetical protein